MKILWALSSLFIAILGAVFIFINVRGLLSLGPRNFLEAPLNLAPLILLFPITLASLLFLRSKVNLWIRSLPVLIGIATMLLGLGILWFRDGNPYFGFYYHKAELDAVVELANAGELLPDQHGRAELPAQYADLSLGRTILISDTLNGTSYYFVIGTDDFDPSTYGYIYRPDGSNPPISRLCEQSGLLKPSAPNWFVCFYGYYSGPYN